MIRMRLLHSLAYGILKPLYPKNTDWGRNYYREESGSKLPALMPSSFFDEIKGCDGLDLGCGEGNEAVDLVLRGAANVTGVDIRTHVLDAAKARARKSGVQDRTNFVTSTEGLASGRFDFIYSIDVFEHLVHPDMVLQEMARLLRPNGRAFLSFGPTWGHPMGGHLLSVPFPWSHLVVPEAVVFRLRALARNDGVMSYAELPEGLNKMTLARFEGLVARSPLRFIEYHLLPIKALEWLSGKWTREFTTSSVFCVLIHGQSRS
jgi:SAM-dependent methyltransferase